MELNNILKTQFNNLKKYVSIYFIILIILSLILFIPFESKIKFYLACIILLSSSIFTIILSQYLISDFGKTYAFLQNNRLIYYLSTLIINIINIIFNLIIFAIIRLAIFKGEISLNYLLFIIVYFLSLFSISSLYALNYKYKKQANIILIFILIIVCLFLYKYIYNTINNLTTILFVNANEQVKINYLVISLITSIVINLVNGFIYIKFNVIKSLS